MPIHNLTTQRRLPRMGKIRLGVKVVNQNGREYPKAVDYFVCPPEVREVYGEQPRALDIILPVDSEELVASTWYKAYSASRGLVCKGDGLSANRLIDAGQKSIEPDTGVVTGPIARREAPSTEMAMGITCPGRDCTYHESNQCRELMSLQFLMPTVPGLGVWQLDTSSYHSIVNIYSGMELIRGIFGTVAMVPLTLSLEPLEVSPEGFKKTVHVLHLRSGGTLAQIAEQRTKPLVPSLMPAPDEEREELLSRRSGMNPRAQRGHSPGGGKRTGRSLRRRSPPGSWGPARSTTGAGVSGLTTASGTRWERVSGAGGTMPLPTKRPPRTKPLHLSPPRAVAPRRVVSRQ